MDNHSARFYLIFVGVAINASCLLCPPVIEEITVWTSYDLPMMAFLLATIGGDNISGDLGDDAGNANIGKNNRQDIFEDRRNYGPQTPVNVYNQFGDDDHRGYGRQGRRFSDAERIDGLEHDVYGRADYWPGLIRRQNQLVQDHTSLRQQLQTVLIWVYFLMGIIAILVILGVINLIVLRMPV